jgi:deoxyribose-phosphate aldolase
MVAHLPYLLEGDVARTTAEVMEVVYAARSADENAVVKVIVESAVLTAGVCDTKAERRIMAACQAIGEAKADFIKTSTGFHPSGGATLEVVRLMKKHAGGLKVKAAGGIRSYDDAVAMVEAGADRLGTSSGVAIVTGGSGQAAY